MWNVDCGMKSREMGKRENRTANFRASIFPNLTPAFAFSIFISISISINPRFFINLRSETRVPKSAFRNPKSAFHIPS